MTTAAEDPPPDRGQLGQLVEDRRLALNLTYRDLAIRAGVGVMTVNRLARGMVKKMPDERTLHGLADALGIDEQVLRTAVMTDLGLITHEVDYTEGGQLRHALYLASAELTKAELHLMLRQIQLLRERSDTE